jgi:hypothetical protein
MCPQFPSWLAANLGMRQSVSYTPQLLCQRVVVTSCKLPLMNTKSRLECCWSGKACKYISKSAPLPPTREPLQHEDALPGASGLHTAA